MALAMISRPAGGRGVPREARAWLAAHVPAAPLPSLETADGFAAHREWERTLAADRWSAVSWPEEFGGRGASLQRWLVFEEEYYAAGAPGRVSQNGISLLAPTLFEHGSPAQLARLLPPMARGEVVWAQAWSEPEAGSDLASLRSTAVRVDGGWLLNGQKTWSSRAAFADRAFGLFRSHPEAERPHRGLTYLMFDLAAPGVAVRPIGRLDGKPAFAELFLDDVFVADEDVIGEPGEGWQVAMSTAGNERGLTLRSPGRFTAAADRLAALWRNAPIRPIRRCATASPTPSSAPAPTSSSPAPMRHGSRPGGSWAPSPASTRSSGRSWTSPCTRPRSTSSAPRVNSPTMPKRSGARQLGRGLDFRAGRTDLRGHQRDPARHHRRATARPAQGQAVTAAPPGHDERTRPGGFPS